MFNHCNNFRAGSGIAYVLQLDGYCRILIITRSLAIIITPPEPCWIRNGDFVDQTMSRDQTWPGLADHSDAVAIPFFQFLIRQ
jgi:hypothetical protein